MSGKKDKKETARVALDHDKLSEIFDRKADDIVSRFESKLSQAGQNPTLANGDDRVVTADDGDMAATPGPRGPGHRGKKPVISPDDAKHTLEGFRALLQGDKRSCLKSWNETAGYARLATGQSSDEISAGGVFVPEGFLQQVIIELANYTPFADTGLIRTIPMEQDVIRVPRVNAKPAKPGVVQEGTAYSETETTLGYIELVARKVGEIIPITEELIQGSSIAMFEFLAELVAEQMADKRTELLTVGVGTDEPQGILNEGDVATVDQAATGLDSDDLIELYYALKPAYRRTALWMMHDSIAKVVRKLKDSNNRYMWTDGGGLGPPQPAIMGRPVFENPEIPTDLGSGSDESQIIFGSFRQGYWFGIRAGIAMSTDSSGSDWKADITNLKFRERYDGKVGDPAAFVFLNKVIE
jgi:HK97 family phage major capsid protein